MKNVPSIANQGQISATKDTWAAGAGLWLIFCLVVRVAMAGVESDLGLYLELAYKHTLIDVYCKYGD